MSLAFSEVFGHRPLLAWLAALAWGLFVITLDAWLIASLHGTLWRRRFWLILPRLALGVVFGVLIAEPFVLRIYETPIERVVLDRRQEQVLAFETRLRQCNPASGQGPPAAIARDGRCSRAQIELSTSAQVGSPSYREAVREAISKKVAVLESSQRDIGLLERLDALHSLTQSNYYLAASEWLLRLFFITIDCLPILVRVAGGATSYDRLVDMRLSTAERLFSEEERTHEEAQLRLFALMRDDEEAQLVLTQRPRKPGGRDQDPLSTRDDPWPEASPVVQEHGPDTGS